MRFCFIPLDNEEETIEPGNIDVAVEAGIVITLMAHYFDFGFGLSLILGGGAMLLTFFLLRCYAFRH